jgi:hypothetical protein
VRPSKNAQQSLWLPCVSLKTHGKITRNRALLFVVRLLKNPRQRVFAVRPMESARQYLRFPVVAGSRRPRPSNMLAAPRARSAHRRCSFRATTAKCACRSSLHATLPPLALLMHSRGERISYFSSPLSSKAKMPPTLPCLLEGKISCTVAFAYRCWGQPYLDK